MPSKFLETARRVVREHPEVFDALLEYERTKKLPKLTYHICANLTIESGLLSKFRAYCAERGMNMSNVVEKHIKKELGLQ